MYRQNSSTVAKLPTVVRFASYSIGFTDSIGVTSEFGSIAEGGPEPAGV